MQRSPAPPRHTPVRLWGPLTLCALLFSGTPSAATAPTQRGDGMDRAARGAAAIDRMLGAEWQRRGITPAPRVDDVGYLRRVYLDLTGTIPPPEAVGAFLADRAPDKRARVVDQLLDSPRYAEHFTDYWEDVLFGRKARRQDIDRRAFRGWLRERLAQDLGWDQIVYQLVSAVGVNSPGGKPDAPPEHPIDPGRVNGAVNFLLLFEKNPQDLGGVVSREFLGAQIQCAQCHNHPTEKWTQDDFRRFVASFARISGNRLDVGKVVGVRRVEVHDSDRPIGGGPMNPELRDIARAAPRALDGTDLSQQSNPRRALAAWMTTAKNQWFGRELANRYWGYLVGRGFFEPVDDQRPTNPATLKPLLDWLAADFAARGFSLKQLIRRICQTRAYQLSAGVARDRDPEHKLWARHPLRPMGPVELFDSVVAATGIDTVLERAAPRSQQLARIRQRLQDNVSFIFDIDEELDPPQYLGTVQQALLLMNGSLLNYGADALPGGTLKSVLSESGTDKDKITAIYLKTLSRPPTPAEIDHWVAFLAAQRELVADQGVQGPPQARPARPAGAGKKGGPPVDPLQNLAGRLRPADPTPLQQAYEDLLWALLNSSEFVFRH